MHIAVVQSQILLSTYCNKSGKSREQVDFPTEPLQVYIMIGIMRTE